VRIRMRVDVSGTREGREWPRRGSVIDLPDDEARQYCEAGMADPVAVFAPVETATMPEPEVRAEPAAPASELRTDTESGAAVRRGPGRPRKTPQMVNAKES
jgi:hypothetical protein